MKDRLYFGCVFLVMVILILCVPITCCALTRDEWNQGCYTKTKEQTTVYSISVDEETGKKNALPAGSLPAGTYIHENTYDYDLRMWKISWYPGDSSAMGWVSRDSLTDATKWVYYSDGSGDPLPEALVNDPAALKSYMSRIMPGYSLNGDGSKPVNPYNTLPEGDSNTVYTGDPDSEKDARGKESTRSAKSVQRNANGKMITACLSSVVKDSLGEQESAVVEVRKLGITACTVYYDGKEETVPTGDLVFAQNVPEGQELAVIYAPRTGYASMRRTAGSNGKVLKKIRAGTIVLVAETGENWVKIRFQDQTGYIAANCLQYYSSETKAKAVGTVSYKGKTTVNTTVNIRNTADKGSYIVTEWKVGKDVIILDQTNGWVKIEADGICGYILEEFVSIKE